VALIPLLGCASEPVSLELDRVLGGVEVVASRPIREVVVTAGGREVRVERPPGARLFVPLEVPRGGTVRAEAAGAVATLAVPAIPADLLLELPRGAPPVLLDDGDVIARAGDPAAGATLRIVSAGSGTLFVGGVQVELGAPGTATAVPLPGTVESLRVSAGSDAVTVGWHLDRAAPVELGEVVFPVGADGESDVARAPDRVTLPPAGMGGSETPWAFAAVRLHNPADVPRSVAVRLAVDDPAFAGARGDATAVVALPAGGDGRALLPVFVAPRRATVGPVSVAVTVTDAGGRTPLASRRTTWQVTRPDGAALAFAASLPVSAGGLALLVWGAPVFLRRTPVPALTLIACLGTVTFVVGAAFQLVGFGVAAALGPFAPFVTALFDDLFRVALLAALVTRVPRPGAASAAAVVGFLMRGLALGGFHPADLLYLGNQVLLLEGNLWLAGITRDAAWKAEPRWRRTARLALGFAPAQALGVALGLLATQALYRLYWAPWYAALLVALPGFLYVVVAAVVSAPLADELDRVVE
jgi:hypothetical protein